LKLSPYYQRREEFQLKDTAAQRGYGAIMRVIVAARLSRKITAADLADGSRGAQTGLESQDAELLAWAEREGHEIVHVAADHKSGTSDPWDRPNLRPWVTEPSKIAQYDGIVAYRLDRLSRGDKRSTSRIEEWAYKHGKKLVTEDGLEFPCEGAAGIRWDVTSRIAHEEWLKISERYTRMGRYLRGAGFHVGRAPYGYMSVKQGEHKTLVPVPAEADVIRDACAWYLSGDSLDAICGKLNEAGRLPRTMKDGRQPRWACSTISKVLHNEVIAGRKDAGNGKTQKVEPIVSREIFDAVNARMAQRAKRAAVSQSKAPALLTSVIYCTACDKPMYRSGTERNRYYHCKTKGCRSTIRVDVADAWIHDQMTSNDRRDVVEVVVPGSGHDVAIADVKRDLAEAVEAEEFERIPALREELSRLRSMPAEPTRVERRESELTVAEMWAVMPDDTERRAYLMSRGARVLYTKAENGGVWLMSELGTESASATV
jgi:site-specific DNA recombinase